MPYLTTIKRPNIPIIKVDEGLLALNGVGSLNLNTNLSGYSSGGAETPTTATPNNNGYVWTLPNGQKFPPTRTVLFSNNRRTYYYEDKNLTTKFQVIGKTIEECSRESGVAVGEFTGLYEFSDVDPFGKGYMLRSLQVKTVFPFDRMGNAVQTQYTLWVDTYVKYTDDNAGQIGYDNNNPAPTVGGSGSASGGGYSTGGNTTGAAKNKNVLFIIGGLLVLIASKAK